MDIPVDRVSKVIINGDWYSVEPGTFRIDTMTFVDDAGAPLHEPLDQLAYSFETPNRDLYYGPLTAIDLFKLVDTATGM